MSALSEKNRLAIFDALSAVTDLATGGVHYMIAAEGTVPPFVVFSRVPVSIDRSLNKQLAGERDMWLIKAVTQDKDVSQSLPPLSPPALAEAILTACEAAIGDALAYSVGSGHGGPTTTVYNNMVYRSSEMPNYIEQLNDRNFYHHGFFLTVYTEN